MAKHTCLLALTASLLLPLLGSCSIQQRQTSGVDEVPQDTYLALSGHIDPAQVFSFVYVPFQVPAGVTNITVVQNYSSKGQGNALDLGVFDPRGTGSIDSLTGFTGSRGWSGGFRNNFSISAAGATPGYNAGPVLPGTWNVVLGPYTSVAEGIDWQLNITLSYDVEATLEPWSPTHAATNLESLTLLQQQRPLVSKPEWLRGDLHMHSVYSDGRYLPSQQIANALAANLSFVFFSEHNTDSGNQNIGSWVEPGTDLLILRAIEVTTRHGHWNAFGLEGTQQVEFRYTNASGDTGYEEAAREVHATGGLVSINHPFQNCSRCDWTLPWEFNDAIEVWNGRFDSMDQEAVDFWHQELVRGKKIVAVGGSDAHHPGDRNGLPTTVVRAYERSQAGVVRGIRDGAVYLVEGVGQELEFWLESSDDSNLRWEIGESVDLDAGAAIDALFVATGFQGAQVLFAGNEGYFHNDTLEDGRPVRQRIQAQDFVRVEVRNSTEILLGLTNPIFLK